MVRNGNNLKVFVGTDVITKRKLIQEYNEEDSTLKWKLQKNIDGYIIYRTIEDITEKFIIKNDKTWFETQLKQTKPKILNSRRFLKITEENNIEILTRGYTSITSYIVEDLQNGELTLWEYSDIPQHFKLIFKIISDYRLEKFFETGRNAINKWFIDITRKKLIATRENLQYTLNLVNGEEVLRRDDTVIFIRHHNILNFNDINFDFNDDRVILNFDQKIEIETIPTE